ncbi:D-alanyl-D-alanine carboxypeptidase family protein [Paenibacillus segetis]|nr:D-alanyl-D-alanine carboxypeptidase family protein [Paenibacillus segetis]
MRPGAPSTNAQASALIDVTSGRILYSSRGDDELPIASLTKIMTAIVAIEHGKLDDMVTVSKNAFAKEGSSIYLQLGEEMSLRNMLYGLMLRSGNDAATAIAEHVGGSEEGFVHLMNEKARLIGLEHTHFQNPHGLDAKAHYSSANDLATLTAYALHNLEFKEIVSTKSKKAPNPNDPWDYKWDNKNKMLRFYEGADGVKTGFTKIARRCLVSSATRGGQQLVVVTLNDGDDWNDHRVLLDYGFANFPLTSLIQEGQAVEGGLVTGKEFRYALANGEAARVERRLVLNRVVPDDFGYRGEIRITLDGKEIGNVPVYEQGSVIPKPQQERQNSSGASTTIKVVTGQSSWSGALMEVFRSLLLVK